VGDLLPLLLTRSQTYKRCIPYARAGADRLRNSAEKKWTTWITRTAPMKEVISGICVLGTLKSRPSFRFLNNGIPAQHGIF